MGGALAPDAEQHLDGICHGEFISAFGVNSGQLPTLVVLSPGRKRYAQLIGTFDQKSISSFLDGVWGIILVLASLA